MHMSIIPEIELNISVRLSPHIFLVQLSTSISSASLFKINKGQTWIYEDRWKQYDW